jgi:hypothetical protein
MWVIPKRLRALVLSLGALALLGWIAADGQAAAPNTAAPNNEVQVLDHVNRVLQWSRLWTGADAYVVVPGDELFVENGQDIARKVVDLEFKSALAQAALIAESSNKPTPSDGATAGTVDAQNLLKLQQNVSQKLLGLNAELETINKQISTAHAKERPALESQRDTLQGQIALAQALQSNLQQLTAFANVADSASGVATELTAKIRALQRTAPDGAVSA